MNCNNLNFCLQNVSIFSDLTNDEKIEIHKYVKHKYYPKGTTIYTPGNISKDLFIVHGGRVRIYRLSEMGKEQLLRIIIPGEFTGELAMFKTGVFEAFAESIKDTYVSTISHTDFKQILLNYPKASIKMLETISKRLSISEEQTSWISTETVKNRIIHYLERSSYVKNNNHFVNIDIPRKDLASYLGTTPESLSREFTKLSIQNKIVDYGDKVKINDVNIKI